MDEIKNSITMFGLTFSKDDVKESWKDKFEVVQKSGELKLRTKEVFSQEEDAEPFNNLTYRFVILALSGGEYGLTMPGEDGEEIEADNFELFLVPTIDKVADETLLNVATDFGIEHLPIEEIRKELTECDLAQCGYGAFLGSFFEPSTTWEDAEKNGWEDGWDEDTLNHITHAMQTIDRLRGFYLDKPANGLGMTGWDYLEMTISGKNMADYI